MFTQSPLYCSNIRTIADCDLRILAITREMAQLASRITGLVVEQGGRMVRDNNYAPPSPSEKKLLIARFLELKKEQDAILLYRQLLALGDNCLPFG